MQGDTTFRRPVSNDEAYVTIGFWGFARLCIRKGWSESWTRADAITGIVGAAAGVIIHFVPRLEAVVSRSLWAIPIIALVCVLVFRLVMSPYWVYRKHKSVLVDHITRAEQNITRLECRLEPRLCIPAIVYEQPLDDGAVTYYFDVINESDGSTVEEVEVKVTAIEPPAVKWLPIPLQIKHDNRPQKTKEFNLNPKDKKQIDLVNGRRGAAFFHIVDVITDVGWWTMVSNRDSTLIVTATGRNTTPAVAKFHVWRDDTGYLRCEAA